VITLRSITDEKLDNFLLHLNSIHINIQFTMETGTDVPIVFLDTDVNTRLDDSLEHRTYRRQTHTNLSLSAISHLHPVYKQAVLSILVHRAKAICDLISQQQELKFVSKLPGQWIQ
jgi:hypothetical protein